MIRSVWMLVTARIAQGLIFVLLHINVIIYKRKCVSVWEGKIVDLLKINERRVSMRWMAFLCELPESGSYLCG